MGVPAQQFGEDPALPLTAELAPSRVPHTFRALRHRNFRLFIGGQIVSLVGTWMQNVAQSWLVYRLTHSELLLGTAWFCSQIAVFALGPLGGIAADRFSRRKVVIVTQTLSMVQAFALAALTLSGRVQVWHVLALAGMLGVINAFDMPGRQALVIQMTSKEDLINAISLNSAVFNAARVVGPAVAGLLLAVVGEGTCFLINGFQLSGGDCQPDGDAAPPSRPAGARADVAAPGGRLPLRRQSFRGAARARPDGRRHPRRHAGPGPHAVFRRRYFSPRLARPGDSHGCDGNGRRDRHPDAGSPDAAFRLGQRDGVQRAHHGRLLLGVRVFPIVLLCRWRSCPSSGTA